MESSYTNLVFLVMVSAIYPFVEWIEKIKLPLHCLYTRCIVKLCMHKIAYLDF